MHSKYKIRLLRANLFTAAIVLALLTLGAPPAAVLVLWFSVGWLFITALLLDFSHRRSQGLPWQMLAGGLLLCLIAADPERHSILIWAWAAVCMLPQNRYAAVFNSCAALLSCALLTPLLSLSQWLLLLLSLSILSFVAISRTRQLVTMNDAIRQRLRLSPGLNLWAGEQLLRDLIREQKRSKREAIYAELLVIQVKRHQLWSTAQQLCEHCHAFENVYRLNSYTLAILLLSRTPQEGTQRRAKLLGTFDTTAYQAISLAELELSNISLETLIQMPKNSLEAVT